MTAPVPTSTHDPLAEQIAIHERETKDAITLLGILDREARKHAATCEVQDCRLCAATRATR